MSDTLNSTFEMGPPEQTVSDGTSAEESDQVTSSASETSQGGRATYDWFVQRAIEETNKALSEYSKSQLNNEAISPAEAQGNIIAYRIDTLKSQGETVTGEVNPTAQEVAQALSQLEVSKVERSESLLPAQNNLEAVKNIANGCSKRYLQEINDALDANQPDKAKQILQQIVSAPIDDNTWEQLANDPTQLAQFLSENLSMQSVVEVAAQGQSLLESRKLILSELNKIDKKINDPKLKAALDIYESYEKKSDAVLEEYGNLNDLLDLIFSARFGDGGWRSQTGRAIEWSGDVDKEKEMKTLMYIETICNLDYTKYGITLFKTLVWEKKEAPSDIFADKQTEKGLKDLFSEQNIKQRPQELKKRLAAAIKEAYPRSLDITDADVEISEKVLDNLFIRAVSLEKKIKGKKDKQETKVEDTRSTARTEETQK